MASLNANRTLSATLTANVADTVSFASNIRTVTVINRSTANDLWVRADGIAATVAGADCYYVGPGQRTDIFSNAAFNDPSTGTVNVLTLSLISATATPYTIQ